MARLVTTGREWLQTASKMHIDLGGGDASPAGFVRELLPRKTIGSG